MTHYHLYIQAGVQLDAATRFYKVGIGQSKDQHRLYAWLHSYAIEHGHFFMLWSNDVAEFFCKCRESIGHGAAPLVTISAADLKKSLKTGCEDPAVFNAILHQHNLLMQIDTHYYMTYQLTKRKPK